MIEKRKQISIRLCQISIIFRSFFDKLRRLKGKNIEYNVILLYFRGIARWFRGHLISELIRRTDLSDCDWPEYESLVEEKKKHEKFTEIQRKIRKTKSFKEKLNRKLRKKEKFITVPDFHVCPESGRSVHGAFMKKS